MFTFIFSPISVSYLQEAAIEPQHAFSTSTSPNELSSQQSRRGSFLESQPSRVSNQNVIGNSPTEIAGATSNEFHANDKYMQDSFETEKRKSNRTYPNNQSTGSNRQGSIRFYDNIQSVNVADKERDETVSEMQQDASMYKTNEFKYNQIPQEYDQTNQTQAAPQEPFYDTQLDYRSQPHDIYESEQYDDSQYTDQQNYDGIQYRTEVPQPTSEYEYQTGYQEYDTQQPIYQSNNLPLEPLQQEQYGTDKYQERATKSTPDIRTVQQYQNYAESNSNNPNMGQKKGNENMSKQSAAEKFA